MSNKLKDDFDWVSSLPVYQQYPGDFHVYYQEYRLLLLVVTANLAYNFHFCRDSHAKKTQLTVVLWFAK